MTRKIRQIAAGVLAAALCLGAASAVETDTAAQDSVQAASVTDPYAGKMLRIGLAYAGNSTGALVEAKLLNADASAVKGYRFGYYDSDLSFVELGRTEETYLTMVKTTNIYRVGESYYASVPSGSYETLGCYHLKHSGSFATFEEAKLTADAIEGGFVAWIDGEYQVRKSSYTTAADAKAALEAENAAAQAETAPEETMEEAPEEAVEETDEASAPAESESSEEVAEIQPEPVTWSLVYTTVYGINVVKTGTNNILFQFDGGAQTPLGVMPGIDTNEGAVTWFKGFKYQGGFRYERIDGGNITVVNIVDVDTYVKGVVPYESNKIWPLETLKAQAMCAKNYGLINLNKHSKYHFDLCTTTECQVYYGLGSGKESFQPSDLSNQAVDETSGCYVWYDGKLAHTYFAASNGGGSEDVSKVWGSNQATYPYLLGVVDPYEAGVADVIPNYSYSNTFTKAELTTILQAKGYGTGTSVENIEVTEVSKTGNALTVKVTYANGKSNTFASSSSSWLRTKLGCRTMHFTITPTGGSTSGTQACSVNGGAGTITSFSGLYAVSGDGTVTAMDQTAPYVITGTGDVLSTQQTTTGTGEVKFVVSGTGNGHGVGYSQWGGYAMGKLGFTYDEILKFYFTGVEVGPKS